MTGLAQRRDLQRRVSPSQPRIVRQFFTAALLLASACGQSPSQRRPADGVYAGDPIHAGDLLQVSVFATPELSGKVQVNRRGAITLPEAGRIPIAGLTIGEAQRRVAGALRDYLLAPQVQILVLRAAIPLVSVLGAVNRPGTYPAGAHTTLLQILARAGGTTPHCSGQVLVTHIHHGKAEGSDWYDLRALQQPGSSGPQLRGNDLVEVFRGGEVYVGGAVRKPGRYALNANPLNVYQAITLAGGLRSGRAQSTAVLVRRNGAGQMLTSLIALETPPSGPATNTRLRAGDLLLVPESTGRKVLLHGAETALATGSAIVTGLIVFH